jgi:hypothetical protein
MGANGVLTPEVASRNVYVTRQAATCNTVVPRAAVLEYIFANFISLYVRLNSTEYRIGSQREKMKTGRHSDACCHSVTATRT